MLIINIVLPCAFLYFCCCDAQLLLQTGRLRRLAPRISLSPEKWKNRLTEKLMEYRHRNARIVCYDKVGCFELPRRRSALQKEPESPEILDTKFYLFRKNIDLDKPEVLNYGDRGSSMRQSKFNASQPLKMIIHGYMSRWNEPGALASAEAYLKVYDCNVILMDWTKGARGPQYATAAANTELVGRQLAILLIDMIEGGGLNPKNIHLVGFSLGAHVAGSASEILKMKGHLIGRITGLDAASPLFRSNMREKYRKLDKEDAHFVDVIHTDASPVFTDGFGLWDPIGHVDFFPNGGQEQPGCVDMRSSLVVAHFEKSLTREVACSHIRAWQLFLETIKLKALGNQSCEFTAFRCTGGLSSFEKGHCFPQIYNTDGPSTTALSSKKDMGRMGEDVMGEGILYFVTRGSSPYCGSQLQASVFVSHKTKPNRGFLQLHLEYGNYSTNFQIKCEVMDLIMTGTEMNGLAAAEYNALNSSVDNIRASLSYINLEYDSRKNETVSPMLYIDRVLVRDMYGNSWQYCGKDTVLTDRNGLHFDVIWITLTRHGC